MSSPVHTRSNTAVVPRTHMSADFDAALQQTPHATRWPPSKTLSFKRLVLMMTGMLALSFSNFALATNYADTIDVFKKAGASAGFFKTAYAYAVFPTVGEGGFIVGAAVGKGRVYVHHRLVGDTTMTQLSAGFPGRAARRTRRSFSLRTSVRSMSSRADPSNSPQARA